MSVFISSHLLSEVQMICDRVAIIHKGKMITVAKVEALIKTASDRVEWIVTPISKAKDMLEAAEEVREVSVEGDRLLCRMDIASISSWNKHFVANEIDVHSVKELVFTLEDLFIELTRVSSMREFANLVLNESEKIYRKKRIFVVMLILAILIPLLCMRSIVK